MQNFDKLGTVNMFDQHFHFRFHFHFQSIQSIRVVSYRIESVLTCNCSVIKWPTWCAIPKTKHSQYFERCENVSKCIVCYTNRERERQRRIWSVSILITWQLRFLYIGSVLSVQLNFLLPVWLLCVELMAKVLFNKTDQRVNHCAPIFFLFFCCVCVCKTLISDTNTDDRFDWY